jgi:holo-[acyl-carrier protein] synthase
MNSWSIGIDIVDVNRFRSLPISDHRRFYKRIFNEYEFQYSIQFLDPYTHFAGIFAAKEAIIKAMSNFFSLKLSLISIYHDEEGKPFAIINKEKLKPSSNHIFDHDNRFAVQVSITHLTDLALAWAVIFKKSAGYNEIDFLNKVFAKTQQVVYNEFQKRSYTSTK